MIPLLLTIICSSSIALIIKQSDSKKGNPVILLNGNYFACSVIAFVYFIIDAEATTSIETLIFSSLLAIMFVAGFFAFAKSVSVAGTALAVVSSRLSVIVPIIFSILLFNEMPNIGQIAGFVFTIITILFFYMSLKSLGAGSLRVIDYSYLFGVLIAIGINDFGMKVFQQWRPNTDQSFFLLTLFSFCFVYTFAAILIAKSKFELQTFKRGLVLGVPNMFSSYFLLGALSQLPGIIVYPVTNIGIILASTFGAALIWKESLNRYGRFALIAGLISILLLSL